MFIELTEYKTKTSFMLNTDFVVSIEDYIAGNKIVGIRFIVSYNEEVYDVNVIDSYNEVKTLLKPISLAPTEEHVQEVSRTEPAPFEAEQG